MDWCEFSEKQRYGSSPVANMSLAETIAATTIKAIHQTGGEWISVSTSPHSPTASVFRAVPEDQALSPPEVEPLVQPADDRGNHADDDGSLGEEHEALATLGTALGDGAAAVRAAG